ncbi:hypothetical protein ccbrp13_70350 [Ktedonobacteria bacterium brp13]|nr:hypothetical protein ccbrp13_70350 [Ktedonobacteria bacterium brp13]
MPILIGLPPINSLQTSRVENDPPWPVLQISPLEYSSDNLTNSYVLENN